ncbi:Cell division protein FtsB [Marinomonas gallaica]|uniref:Cell division protein FtsB n=1 Tax=Marinomonas gallaica TaxID=1806667 RepID=A0A1C3JLP4_9GAMM|nr:MULTISPECIES: septum formation initiator family protein [Marinomonas]SBT16138.1 Cell division protein FtsB [Marinomonas gallaica]SBT21186.1 Cell division protein FtsB [Marinomonas gallaica]
MMLRIFIAIFLSVSAYFFYQSYWGEQGIKREEELAKQIEYQEQINKRLKVRNDALRAQISDLRRGGDAIEEHVRTELQYIKDGEVFYRIVEK